MRGPLHGIPIALKDNIHTTDMPTTGGALAFKGFVPPYEATLTKNLRDAGRDHHCEDEHDRARELDCHRHAGQLQRDCRIWHEPVRSCSSIRDRATDDGRPALNPGGSSSGAGTSANFWAANVGTETSGSILTPANQTMLVGIKPTVGRISRYGIIPITADQDTAGPMARTVADAALLLGVLEGAAPDPHDPATKACPACPGTATTRDFSTRERSQARALACRARRSSMKDARAGAARCDRAAEEARRDGRRSRGHSKQPPPVCRDQEGMRGKDPDCSIVFKYGMKRDFNAWLASLGPSAPIKTLTELREWNLAHRAEGALKYGQAQLDISDEVDLERDRERYLADRARDVRLTGAEGIDAVMKRERLDALLFRAGGGVGGGGKARVSDGDRPVRVCA